MSVLWHKLVLGLRLIVSLTCKHVRMKFNVKGNQDGVSEFHNTSHFDDGIAPISHSLVRNKLINQTCEKTSMSRKAEKTN